MKKLNKRIEDHYLNRGVILVSCPEQEGVVATMTTFLYNHGANIIESSQYSSEIDDGKSFVRIEFNSPNLKDKFAEMKQEFEVIAEKFQMDWKMTYFPELKRTAIFVSKEQHCLLELVWEWQNGGLLTDIALIVSNHEDAREVAESLNIPFYYIPASKENRAEVEEKQLQLLEEYKIDLIVLARYMQILTPKFVAEHPGQVINIHHSFLPAFIGARPYERAYQRGVKLIGATSHYVTNDLDEGPIIEQDIHRVDHRNSVTNLKNFGATVERSVLSRAVRWHLEDRVIVHNNKTIIF